jgi:hypothetical protein
VTGSLIGRSLVAIPALLAAIGIGVLLAGLTGSVTAGLLTTVVLASIVVARAARTGVTVDLDRQEVVVRSFWRTNRVEAASLQRVDASARSPDGTAGVRFLLRDGRELASVALVYLTDRPATQLIADLGQLTLEAPFEVALTPGSFRGPSVDRATGEPSPRRAADA